MFLICWLTLSDFHLILYWSSKVIKVVFIKGEVMTMKYSFTINPKASIRWWGRGVKTWIGLDIRYCSIACVVINSKLVLYKRIFQPKILRDVGKQIVLCNKEHIFKYRSMIGDVYASQSLIILFTKSFHVICNISKDQI